MASVKTRVSNPFKWSFGTILIWFPSHSELQVVQLIVCYCIHETNHNHVIPFALHAKCTVVWGRLLPLKCWQLKELVRVWVFGREIVVPKSHDGNPMTTVSSYALSSFHVFSHRELQRKLVWSSRNRFTCKANLWKPIASETARKLRGSWSHLTKTRKKWKIYGPRNCFGKSSREMLIWKHEVDSPIWNVIQYTVTKMWLVIF